VLFCIYLFGTPAAGANDQLSCDNLSADRETLPISVITSLQDSRGFVWRGGQAGLSRYDGYRFKVFKKSYSEPNSLPDSYVQDLLEDPDGHLWIATMSGGLVRYDPRTDHFESFQHDPSREDSISSNRVQALAMDADGRLWVATWGGGLNRLEDANSGRFQNWHDAGIGADGSGNDSIRSLLIDSRGVVWVGTSQGLLTFDPSESRFNSVPLSGESRLQQPSVNTLAEGSNGALWVGTESQGLFRLNGVDGPVVQYRHEAFDPTTVAEDRIETVFVDRDSQVWVGTTRGLSLYQAERDEFSTYVHDPIDEASLPSNRVVSIMQDRSGILWFGTWTSGLCKRRSAATDFRVYRTQRDNPGGLADNRVRDFFEAPDGSIWIALLGGGVARFEPDTEQFRQFLSDPFYPNSISSNNVHTVDGDAQGFLWVGTRDAGLNRLDPRTGNAVRYRHEPGNPKSIGGNHILDVLVDDEQNLWIATWDRGLSRMDLGSGEIRHYRYEPNDDSSLSTDSIGFLYQSRSGEIWIGSRFGGLAGVARMIRDPLNPMQISFETRTTADGLAGDAIGAAVVDGSGRLWLSTLFGISSYDPLSGQFSNFNHVHGTQKAGYYVGSRLLSRDGEIYFGGVDGFTRFLPLDFVEDEVAPQVAIIDLLISNRSALIKARDPASPLETTIGYTRELTLRHDQEIFGFEFTGLHFVEPSKNRYAFMLEGFDPDWVETTSARRHATYTNLDSGRYVFRVKAANHDGVWSPEEANVVVTVLSPPWKTWWAYLSYALILIALGGSFGWYRYRTHRAEQHANEAIRQSEERLKLALWGSGDELWFFDIKEGTFRRMAEGDEVAYKTISQVHDTESFYAVVHPDDRETVKEAFRQYLADEVQCFEAVYRVHAETGQWMWVLSKGRVVSTDEKGEPLVLAGANKDITALKRTEEAVVELNEKLESLVEDRTRDLRETNVNLQETLDKLRNAQRQLVESEKMASLGGLVAGVAHEINTPLGVAVTAASHLEQASRKMLVRIEQGDFSEDQARSYWRKEKENTGFILNNLRRAAELVRSFKQVAVDQSSEELRSYVLDQYLEEILSSLRPRFKHSRRRIEVECPANLVMDSYPGALYQIITNLTINSLVHGFAESDDGLIELTVTDLDQQVMIEYRDDGKGFDNDIAEKIFEPFFTTERGKGGSGLGMHIVYNLVTQMLGGNIECEGKPGEGVLFRIIVPKVTYSGTPVDSYASVEKSARKV
jgi:PAS domain S-box-containing protein